MRRQFRFVCIGVFRFALVLGMSGCASALTPRYAPPPTATMPLPPAATATTVPSAIPTNSPATATMPTPSTAASKPTVVATAVATQGSQPTTSTTAAAVSKYVCLGCHGPFNKIIASSTNYVAPSGEKTSPHRYVPHDANAAVNIPECTNCHTAHSLSPLPTAGSIDLSKVGVGWCYVSCHHQNNFTP